MTGNIVMAANIAKSSDNSSIELKGGSAWAHGALLALNGKDNTGGAGKFYLYAHDGTNSCTLVGTPYGSLTWGEKAIDTIEEQGDNYIRYSNGIQICWGLVSLNAVDGTTHNTTTSNFSKGYKSAPCVTATNLKSGFGWAGFILAVDCSATSVTFTQWTVAGATSATDNKLNYIAIGKWK